MEVIFILVEPGLPENIGASARALKTMGFQQLRLVGGCSPLDPRAQWVAYGSGDILTQIQVFPDLNSALADLNLTIATTAKERIVKRDRYPSHHLANFLRQKGNSVKRVGIVFGRENNGLSNQEVRQCDLISSIGIDTCFPSLNLGQAVMLYAYELAQLNFDRLEIPGSGQPDPSKFPALKQKVLRIFNRLKISPQSTIYHRYLERLSYLNGDDIDLLHSFCNQLLGFFNARENDE
jgi:tRNA/rRNA methyltransferase